MYARHRATLMTAVYVLVVAGLLAATTTNLLAGTLAPLTVAPPHVSQAPSSSDAPRAMETEGFSPYWTVPTQGPATPTPVVTPTPKPEARPFEVRFQLIGTFVAERDAWSTVMLRDPSSGDTLTVGLGERISEVARVVRIEHGSVTLERDDEATVVLPISG